MGPGAAPARGVLAESLVRGSIAGEQDVVGLDHRIDLVADLQVQLFDGLVGDFGGKNGSDDGNVDMRRVGAGANGDDLAGDGIAG